ncbi:MAG: hypothetical protein FJ245_07090 [Nitrospira sp.]|nr:hypothetical protein [Nitrospira sp.]
MTGNERKLCLLCAGRASCEGKYHMPGGQALHCLEYRRDTGSAPAEGGKRNVLIIGPAGTDRTRLVEEIALRTGAKPNGYYTKVVKDGLFRSHAELVLWSDGVARTLPTDAPDTVDRQLVPLLEQALRADVTGLLVLDEVGALQCASALFRRLLVDCFTSDKNVLATMSLGGREEDFLLSLESRADITVLPMSDGWRDSFADLVACLLSGAPAPQPEPAY